MSKEPDTLSFELNYGVGDFEGVLEVRIPEGANADTYKGMSGGLDWAVTESQFSF